ncbi:GNAT family N-acetyltransferase [Lachnospiraceae bacterium C1.1]
MELIVKHFDELTTRELYEILKTRSEIFVVEQDCVYQDLDDKDQDAIHVFGWNDEGRVAGCLRVFMKDAKKGIVQIGRVVTLEHGKGLGGKLLREGVKVATKSFNAIKIYLEAQVYAIGYYAKEGFEVVSDEFMEDGILHVKMEKRVRTDDGLPLTELNVLSEEEIQEARDKKDKEIAEKSCKTKLSDLQVSELYSDHMTKKPEVLKLHLELKMKRASREDVEVLRRLGKVEKDRITRDILVPADITLHALSYAIQRSFGWQNSHLHCFKYPAAVFQEMTGGKEEPRDDVYAKYDGLVTEWIKLCGLYFRFPTTEYEDLYWDDDYEDG